MRTRLLRMLFAASSLSIVIAGPSAAQIAIGSALRHDTEAVPGSSYTGTILVRNMSDVDEQARIYQTDYRFSSDGTNEFGDPGSTPRSNGNWVHVSASTVTVPALGVAPLEFRVNVPLDQEGASLEGSYWSLIMVEGIPRASVESTLEENNDDPDLGVRQLVRYAIQIATHIQGTGESRLSATLPAVSVDATGGAVLRVDVENIGTRYSTPETWVELYDSTGSLVGRFDGTQARIYPGTSVRHRYDLGALSAGQYQALTIFDSGGEAVEAAEYSVLIE